MRIKIKDRLKTTGYRPQGGPSFAPNIADSGGAFSFVKASENALEGSRIRIKIK